MIDFVFSENSRQPLPRISPAEFILSEGPVDNPGLWKKNVFSCCKQHILALYGRPLHYIGIGLHLSGEGFEGIVCSGGGQKDQLFFTRARDEASM